MKNDRAKTRPLNAEDAEFLIKLFYENEKNIKGIVYNTLGKLYGHLAEDALGELCLLACEKIDIIKAHKSPKAWLIVASKHVAQGLIKKHKKDLLNIPLEKSEETVNDNDLFEEVVYATWLENKVPEKLIASLTKREKEVYYKLYIEKKTPKEAASELGVKLNLINNVHKNLRDKIKDAVKRKNF